MTAPDQPSATPPSVTQSSVTQSSASRPIRVLLADDEQMIRAGVRMILRHADDIEVVGEASNGAEAVQIAASQPVDVALVDIRMPVMDGLAAIGPLVHLNPAPQVVMLTTFGDEDNVTRALQSGACGFLLKDEGPQELISAVRAAAAGDAVLSPGVTGYVVKRMLEGGPGIPAAPAPPVDRLAALSEVERRGLSLLGQGMPNSEIGRHLRLGLDDVKLLVGDILDKTGADSRVQAALLAQQTGV